MEDQGPVRARPSPTTPYVVAGASVALCGGPMLGWASGPPTPRAPSFCARHPPNKGVMAESLKGACSKGPFGLHHELEV